MVGANLIEQQDEWIVARRYFSPESMSKNRQRGETPTCIHLTLTEVNQGHGVEIDFTLFHGTLLQLNEGYSRLYQVCGRYLPLLRHEGDRVAASIRSRSPFHWR